MALIAARAAVHVVPHALMLLVGLCLRVTPYATEHGVIRRIGVASRANAIRSTMIRREPRVIEGRTLP